MLFWQVFSCSFPFAKWPESVIIIPMAGGVVFFGFNCLSLQYFFPASKNILLLDILIRC